MKREKEIRERKVMEKICKIIKVLRFQENVTKNV